MNEATPSFRRPTNVAIGMEPDNRGDYRVRTCYLLEAEKGLKRRA
jgi:hypothetical protein